jgi:xyloglucan-specific exo-beta-1,4-glucanase
LLKSNDEGVSWSKISSLPSGEFGNGISFVTGLKTATTTYIYAAVAGDGIYRSTNMGVSWSKFFSIPTGQYPYRSKALNNGKFYFSLTSRSVANSASGGLYRFDGVSTVANISPIAGQAVTGFDIDNSGKIVADAHSTDYFDNGNQSMYQSTNDGVNWTRLNRTFTVPKWYSTQTPGSNPYDPNWYMMAQDFFFSSLNFDPFDNNKLYFGNGWAIFGTEQANLINQSWSSKMQGLEELVVNNVNMTDSGKLLTGGWDMGGFIQSDSQVLPDFHISNDALVANVTGSDWSKDGSITVVTASRATLDR